MLRGYYDASGKSDDPATQFLTLTGLVASESVWRAFEGQWQAVLNGHGVSRLHMTDAMSLHGEFSRTKSWNTQRVDALICDLWNVIGKFRYSVEDKRSNLTAFSCTIIMDDYRRAKQERALREPEAICMNFCFKLPQDIDPESKEPANIVMVFDRDENFQKTITRVWERDKGKKSAGWPRQITHIVNRDTEFSSLGTAYHAPLQAADMIAWLTSNHYRNPSRVPIWDIGLVLGIAHYMKPYNYAALMQEYPNG